jgi:hypothetical protein
MKNFKKLFQKVNFQYNQKNINNLTKRYLNIHEYDGKKLMTKYNVPHQRGFVITNTNQVKETCHQIEKEYSSKNFIVKSQILAGGRGKGVFDTGYKGGVKFCPRYFHTILLKVLKKLKMLLKICWEINSSPTKQAKRDKKFKK